MPGWRTPLGRSDSLDSPDTVQACPDSKKRGPDGPDSPDTHNATDSVSVSRRRPTIFVFA